MITKAPNQRLSEMYDTDCENLSNHISNDDIDKYRLESISNENKNITRMEKQKNEINFMDFSNFDMAWKTAGMLSKAKCIPKEFWDNPADILVAVQYGHDLGLKPMVTLQNSMIIGNRPAIWGDIVLAVCMSTKGKEGGFIDCIETYDEETETAYCTIEREGRKSITKHYSRKKAETARLWGKTGQTGNPSSWVTSPERMLQCRARGFALRDMFPDILKGVVTVEEMRDVQRLDSDESKDLTIKNTVDSMKERLKAKNNNLNATICLDNESKGDL